jgi:hypothetical protein
MPRKKLEQPAAAPEVAPQEQTKKWADPYRPITTNNQAGFELGENKLANLLVFSFSNDPGQQVKDRLKHYGYFYDVRQKAWTANATPVTREIARKLASEFAGAKGIAC